MDGRKKSGGISSIQRFIQREKKDVKSYDLLMACLAEVLGTMILVLFCLCAVGASSTQIAIQVGFLLAVLIGSLWNISGGHVNPAISIAFVVTGKITVLRFIFYVISQCIGAVAGAGIAKLITSIESQDDGFGVIEPAQGIADYQAVLCEFFITFMLCFATMSYIDEERKDLQGTIPLMIGVLVSMNIITAGNISGGCMNPAREFGPSMLTGNHKYHWIYWVGPMSGGAVGALLYDKVFAIGKRRCPRCFCHKTDTEAEQKEEKISLNGDTEILTNEKNELA